MGKPHPMELRSLVIAFIEEGHGHREAARHFRVSPRFVNDMVILKRESGGLSPKAQGQPYGGQTGALHGLAARPTGDQGRSDAG